MPSHMGVQRFAAKRNDQAEILIDFILQAFITRLYQEGCIVSPELPDRQKRFVRDDCSDIFDHFVELEMVKPFGGIEGRFELWAQTTCYRGNVSGRAESNKTYEIRETLVEALGLRRWLREEGVSFRTIHFTIGPVNYTYSWFKSAKDSAFDLSLYPNPDVNTDILFKELSTLFSDVRIEYEIYDRLELNLNNSDSQITKYIRTTLDQMNNWFIRGIPQADMADGQADLLTELRQMQQESMNRALSSSTGGGLNIKGQVQELLEGNETNDPALVRTLRRLNLSNPFLAVALEAELNWHVWSSTHFAIPIGCRDLPVYIQHLWTTDGDQRLINRRLLLRVHTDEPIRYIQDTNIPGLTEHNLYNGNHSVAQVQAIVERISASCEESGICTATDLYAQLVSQHGQGLLRSARRFESVNGTNLKPSFFYLEESLANEYEFTLFRQTDLPPPIAYHGSFSTAQAYPYENMKVVINRQTQRPVAIIKAKFFRRQEFPRRAKEESYVGFTTTFTLINGDFRERYVGVPLVMFVDMATSPPPSYAVRRLVTAGWEVFFSIDELRMFLSTQV